MRVFITILLMALSFGASAQQMVEYSPDYDFVPGIYLKFEQFRNNTPIPPNKIVSKYYKPSDPDFLENVLSRNAFKIRDKHDSIIELSTDRVWGFSRNGNVYVQVDGEYFRIPVIGRISHFVATVTVYYNTFNDPFYGPGTVSNTTQEMRQFILDFETGEIMEFALENLSRILKRDPELYNQFSELKKRKKRKLMFYYLRKYNEKHPIYFPE